MEYRLKEIVSEVEPEVQNFALAWVRHIESIGQVPGCLDLLNENIDNPCLIQAGELVGIPRELQSQAIKNIFFFVKSELGQVLKSILRTWVEFKPSSEYNGLKTIITVNGHNNAVDLICEELRIGAKLIINLVRLGSEIDGKSYLLRIGCERISDAVGDQIPVEVDLINFLEAN